MKQWRDGDMEGVESSRGEGAARGCGMHVCDGITSCFSVAKYMYVPGTRESGEGEGRCDV